MASRAGGVAHIVQAVEYRDQIVILSRIPLGRGHLEGHPVADSLPLRRLPRAGNRLVMIIESEELRFRECFRHQDRRSAFAAAHISHPRSCFKFLGHALKRRNPRGDKIRGIARAEKPFAPMKDAFVMLVPAHPCPRAKGLGDPWNRSQRTKGQLEGAGKIRRTVFVGQSKGLLFAQAELSGLFVVSDVPAGRLGGEPFANVTLIGSGFGREFRGSHRLRGKRLVKP